MRGIWRYFDLANETYARSTDRARLAFALAEQFAIDQRAPQIEPEHILRGLASNGRGVGRTVLEEMGIDFAQLLPDIVQLLRPFPEQILPPIEVIAPTRAAIFETWSLGEAASTVWTQRADVRR